MHLIIGGAYQGKTAFAVSHFNIPEQEIHVCTDAEEPVLNGPGASHLERFARFCLRSGKNPTEEMRARRAQWRDSVLICTDISCGVVPVDPELRAWREETGRMLNYLAGEADSVTRLFCGLPQVLK